MKRGGSYIELLHILTWWGENACTVFGQHCNLQARIWLPKLVLSLPSILYPDLCVFEQTTLVIQHYIMLLEPAGIDRVFYAPYAPCAASITVQAAGRRRTE